MSEGLPEPVRSCIEISRQKCLVADYQGAVEVLSTLKLDPTADATCSTVILTEIARVLIANGNYQAAKTEFPSQWPQEDTPYTRLLRIQKAYVEILTDCNLAEALDVGLKIWAFLEDGTEGGLSSIEIRMHYYCLEIFDFIMRYGDRKQKKKLPATEQELQILANFSALSMFGFDELKLELLGLVENLIAPGSAIEVLAFFLGQEQGPAKVDVSLKLLRFSIKLGRMEDDDIETALESISSLVAETGHRAGQADVDVVRFLHLTPETALDLQGRANNLIRISQEQFERGYLEKSMWTLEAILDLLSTFGHAAPDWAIQTDIRVHGLLQANHRSSGDQLGLLQVSFRECELLNSLTAHTAQAREKRNDLLRSPLCSKVPTFGELHLRQSDEYMMLDQAEDALYHMRRYSKYCKKCRPKSEQFLARTNILAIVSNSGRQPHDSRVNQLTQLLSYLAHNIRSGEADLTRLKRKLSMMQSRVEAIPNLAQNLAEHTGSPTPNFDESYLKAEIEKFHFSQAGNHLLKVELQDECDMLELEDPEVTVETLLDILECADRNCRQAGKGSRVVILQNEIWALMAVFGSFQSNQGAAVQNSHRGDFSTTLAIRECYTLLLAAEVQNSYVMLEKSLEMVKQKEMELVGADNPLLRWSVFLLQATVMFVISRHTEPEAYSLHSKADSQGLSLLGCIEKALEQQELLRNELTQGPRWGNLKRKQAFLAGTHHLPLLGWALEACFHEGDPKVTWLWSQKAKARAIYDEKMARNSEQPPFPIASIDDMISAAGTAARKTVFIDWVTTGDGECPFMLVALGFEPDEDGRLFSEFYQKSIKIREEDVVEWTDGLRSALYRPDAQEYLDRLQIVISPLEDCSKEGDLLVLSPTTHLHNFPLHALHLGGRVLLERNPVAYTPSFSVMIECMRHLSAPEPGAEMPQRWKAAFMGTYDDTSNQMEIVSEREGIYNSLRELASDFGDTEVIGPDLTTTAFKENAVLADLIHFHGHGSYNQHDVEQQSLVLGGNEMLGLSEIIQDLDLRNSPHVTIIACEAGIQDFSLGRDEPLGLPTAFLLAGATSVIAPMWPIRSEDGRALSRNFYHHFLHHNPRLDELGPIVNLALALREAALAIREENPGPYHWAAYMLYGAWYCRKKPGTW